MRQAVANDSPRHGYLRLWTAAQSAGITRPLNYAATVNSAQQVSRKLFLFLDADTIGAITAGQSRRVILRLVTLTDANGNNAAGQLCHGYVRGRYRLIAVDAITSVAVEYGTVETIIGTVEELVSYRGGIYCETITGFRLLHGSHETRLHQPPELLRTGCSSKLLYPDVNLISIDIDGTASKYRATLRASKRRLHLV